MKLSTIPENLGRVFILLYILLPIFWITITAFKRENDVFTLKVFFQPTLQNFVDIFSNPLNFGPLLRNSLLISLGTIAIAIPLAIMASYVFSRYQFRGSSLLLVWVLATQFVPPVVVAIPFFTFFRNINLIDTPWALIIVNLSLVLPYAIWLIKGFVDAQPVEIEEAATVDGCNIFQILQYVTFPLILPGVIVAAAFSFILAWNEFLFALIMTNSDAAETLQVGLLATQSARGVVWEQMSATGLLIMVPIFVLSIFIRKHFISGITMGAVK